jgi:uncharacterized Zn finger protein (UPF0148 family)
MSKAHSGTESSTGDQLRCPTCDHTGRFSLASDGELRCPACGDEFDPHADEADDVDPNEPKNPNGLESDAVDPDGDEPGTFWCPECGARVTRGPTGVEYGHRAGHAPDKNDGERCSRRPAMVDTDDGRVKSALSMHETLGIGRFADASD